MFELWVPRLRSISFYSGRWTQAIPNIYILEGCVLDSGLRRGGAGDWKLIRRKGASLNISYLSWGNLSDCNFNLDNNNLSIWFILITPYLISWLKILKLIKIIVEFFIQEINPWVRTLWKLRECERRVVWPPGGFNCKLQLRFSPQIYEILQGGPLICLLQDLIIKTTPW